MLTYTDIMDSIFVQTYCCLYEEALLSRTLWTSWATFIFTAETVLRESSLNGCILFRYTSSSSVGLIVTGKFPRISALNPLYAAGGPIYIFLEVLLSLDVLFALIIEFALAEAVWTASFSGVIRLCAVLFNKKALCFNFSAISVALAVAALIAHNFRCISAVSVIAGEIIYAAFNRFSTECASVNDSNDFS